MGIEDHDQFESISNHCLFIIVGHVPFSLFENLIKLIFYINQRSRIHSLAICRELNTCVWGFDGDSDGIHLSHLDP